MVSECNACRMGMYALAIPLFVVCDIQTKMKTYDCGHRHNNPCCEWMQDNARELYFRWKYTVGASGSLMICWNCFLKMKCQGDMNKLYK